MSERDVPPVLVPLRLVKYDELTSFHSDHTCSVKHVPQSSVWPLRGVNIEIIHLCRGWNNSNASVVGFSTGSHDSRENMLHIFPSVLRLLPPPISSLILLSIETEMDDLCK